MQTADKRIPLSREETIKYITMQMVDDLKIKAISDI